MTLLRRDMNGRSAVTATGFGDERAAYLSRLCRLLWPDPTQVEFTHLGRGSTDARQALTSGEECRELIVLPSHAEPRLLVPIERRAAAAAVRRYGEPGSRASSLRKWAMWLATTSNAAPRLFHDRLVIRAPRDAETIASYLSAVLGRDLRVSMYVSAARANRKPVLQMLTPHGDAMGFAKIGIDPLTRQLVRAERQALGLLETARPRSLTAARVLHHGDWKGLEVLVLSPLPVWHRRRAVSRSRLLEAMQEVAGVAGMIREPLAAAAHWRRLLDRLSSAPDGQERAALESALRTLVDQAGETVLSYGSWHGDWSPWNMAGTRAGLLMWDWERFSTGVPLGFDALHHWVQTEIGRRHRRPAIVAREVVDRAAALLGVLGLGPREARLTALLYLAEVATRDLVDRQEDAGAWAGGARGWLIPAITSELEQ